MDKALHERQVRYLCSQSFFDMFFDKSNLSKFENLRILSDKIIELRT